MFELEGLEVFFYTLPVDMRCSIDGLSIIVSERLSLDPTKGALYVFFNKSQDKLKILYWQRNGFCLWYKRLEKERFKVPLSRGVLTLTFQQLRWLLDGLDYTRIQGHKPLFYKEFF
jgi:transposase